MLRVVAAENSLLKLLKEALRDMVVRVSAEQGGDDAVEVLLVEVVTAGGKSRLYGICESETGWSHVLSRRG